MQAKRITNRLVAEALLARFTRIGVTRVPADVTTFDLDTAYEEARDAVGNPLPSIRPDRMRGVGPKVLALSEDRHDKVLEIYATLFAAKARSRSA